MTWTARLSRRRFTQGATAVGIVTGVGGVAPTWAWSGGGTASAFAVSHGPEVYVTWTQGRRFTVEVRNRADDGLLERFERVTANRLTKLGSSHCTFVEVPPPTP